MLSLYRKTEEVETELLGYSPFHSRRAVGPTAASGPVSPLAVQATGATWSPVFPRA